MGLRPAMQATSSSAASLSMATPSKHREEQPDSRVRGCWALSPYTRGTAWVRVRGDRGIEASVPSLVGKLLASYFSRSKSWSKEKGKRCPRALRSLTHMDPVEDRLWRRLPQAESPHKVVRAAQKD